jgi:type III secretion protein T
MATSPEFEIISALALRSFGFILSLPLGELLGTLPRFCLAAGMGLALRPLVIGTAEINGATLVFEFVIGFILGTPLRLISDVSEMVGELLDTARGQTVSAVLDPLHGQGVSDLATIARSASIAFALLGGALDISVKSLADSVRHVPPGMWSLSPHLPVEILNAGGNLVMSGLRIGAVWFVAFLMIEILCAMASRLVTGLSFSQMSYLLKSIVTFFLIAILLAQGGVNSIADIVRATSPRSSLGTARSSTGGAKEPEARALVSSEFAGLSDGG